MATDRLEQLRAALTRGREQRDLRGPLASFERRRTRSASLARLLLDTLTWVQASELIRDGEAAERLWTPLMDLIDNFDGREALNVLRREGVEPLSRFAMDHFESADEGLADGAMRALQLLGRSGSRDGAELIVALARRGSDEGYGWSDVFDAVAEGRSAGRLRVSAIARPAAERLPRGRAAGHGELARV